MSIDLPKDAGSNRLGGPNRSNSTVSIYETRTLMCKNNCGYYGNSMQYEGYCSICYRKLKSSRLNNNQTSNSNGIFNSSLTASASFDDSSSLLNFDDRK